MTAADYERCQAAAAKRYRKLRAKYLDRPEAIARRAEIAERTAAGFVWRFAKPRLGITEGWEPGGPKIPLPPPAPNGFDPVPPDEEVA